MEWTSVQDTLLFLLAQNFNCCSKCYKVDKINMIVTKWIKSIGNLVSEEVLLTTGNCLENFIICELWLKKSTIEKLEMHI